jgi:hypothetical protein
VQRNCIGWGFNNLYCDIISKAILQSIISTIVFVYVRANNRSELLYQSQTTLQHTPLYLTDLILLIELN